MGSEEAQGTHRDHSGAAREDSVGDSRGRIRTRFVLCALHMVYFWGGVGFLGGGGAFIERESSCCSRARGVDV